MGHDQRAGSIRRVFGFVFIEGDALIAIVEGFDPIIAEFEAPVATRSGGSA